MLSRMLYVELLTQFACSYLDLHSISLVPLFQGVQIMLVAGMLAHFKIALVHVLQGTKSVAMR